MNDEEYVKYFVNKVYPLFVINKWHWNNKTNKGRIFSESRYPNSADYYVIPTKKMLEEMCIKLINQLKRDKVISCGYGRIMVYADHHCSLGYKLVIEP